MCEPGVVVVCVAGTEIQQAVAERQAVVCERAKYSVIVCSGMKSSEYSKAALQ